MFSTPVHFGCDNTFAKIAKVARSKKHLMIFTVTIAFKKAFGFWYFNISVSRHEDVYWKGMKNTVKTTEIWVNIGSGNGLLPDGTKPLPEPMLTYHQ